MDAPELNTTKRDVRWDEYSINIETILLPSLLKLVASLISSGISVNEIKEIVDVANATPLDNESSLKFPIVVDDIDCLLIIQVFKDDVGSSDIRLITESNLCNRIRSMAEQFID